jgi:class 3 adenylate cyclase/HAMP domain-containing protein
MTVVRQRYIFSFALCMVFSIFAFLICFFFIDFLRRPVFEGKISFITPAVAKYARDGNVYVIDNGSFRIICMTPDGHINYTITIDKMTEYTRFVDLAVDEAGNLYVYTMEGEYDAFMTKRDSVQQYDNRGRFVRNILSATYSYDSPDQPRMFPQFGSLRYEGGILTFSRTQENQVQLWSYNTVNDIVTSSFFDLDVSDFSVSRLTLKDFSNFIYSTRSGDIYEVKGGAPPLRRASFDFTREDGGIIPWYLDYDERGDIVFLDMASVLLYRIDSDDTVRPALPEQFFRELREAGQYPLLANFGFTRDHFAGIYGEEVWYYDGTAFRTYGDGVMLRWRERAAIVLVQCVFAAGIITLIAAFYLLFIHILNRFVSLFIKQTIVIIPLVIAAFAVFYSVAFNMQTERINQEVTQSMKFLSWWGGRQIDGNEVEDLKSIKDFHSDSYRGLLDTVKQIIGHNNDEWNQRYYIAIYIGDHFEYVMMQSNDEMNMFRRTMPLDEWTGEYADFMSGQPVFNSYELPDAIWAASQAPIYAGGGKIVGMFEVGLNMTGYQIANMKQRQWIAGIAALICVIILFALIIITSVVVRYLASVGNIVASIAQGNYSVRVSYRAHDELGSLSHGLNDMAAELQKQIEHVQKMNESTIRFVPIQFMEYLGSTDITKMKLGDNVQRDLTVLFFDIRAFSINSEMMSVRENFVFINKILSVSGPIIRKYNGFVDKFMGDAAMALFVHAIDAVRAGIEIYHTLVLDESTRIKTGIDGINIGVGIHTGSVMMGIVGEEKRLSSTVISKNVNLASRMESLTKQVKSGMLITRDTMDQVGNAESTFDYRFIGMIQASGVNEVIGVFDVLNALPERTRRVRLATRQVFESGVRKYHTRDYAGAQQRFEKVVAADPSDVCAAICLTETKKHIESPKLPSVFVFDKK